MAKLKWGAKFCVGIEELDEQRREFIEIYNDLSAAALRGRGHRLMGEILDRLVAYAEDLFAKEEKVLEEIGYPEVEFHALEHAQLLKKVHRFKTKYAMDLERITMPVLKFFDFWLKKHLLDSDMDYGRFHAEANAEPSEEEATEEQPA